MPHGGRGEQSHKSRRLEALPKDPPRTPKGAQGSPKDPQGPPKDLQGTSKDPQAPPPRTPKDPQGRAQWHLASDLRASSGLGGIREA